MVLFIRLQIHMFVFFPIWLALTRTSETNIGGLKTHSFLKYFFWYIFLYCFWYILWYMLILPCCHFSVQTSFCESIQWWPSVVLSTMDIGASSFNANQRSPHKCFSKIPPASFSKLLSDFVCFWSSVHPCVESLIRVCTAGKSAATKSMFTLHPQRSYSREVIEQREWFVFYENTRHLFTITYSPSEKLLRGFWRGWRQARWS